MVIRKYGEEKGDWCSRTLTEGHGVGLWKANWCGWKRFYDRIGFRVGNGKMVRFWKDRWCGEEPLMTFQELFSIATDKKAWVDQMWEQVGEAGCWNLIFTR